MKVKQTIQGRGRAVSRTSAPDTPGWVRFTVTLDDGDEATLDVTVTATGQVWMNSRDPNGHGSSVALAALFGTETGTWTLNAPTHLVAIDGGRLETGIITEGTEA